MGKVIKGVADFLKDMPGWAKTAFAALATGAAILGPLLLVVGAIARNLAAIQAFRAGSNLAGLASAAGGGAGQAAGGGAAAGGAAAGGAGGKFIKGAAKVVIPVAVVLTGMEALGLFDKWASGVKLTAKELSNKSIPELSTKFSDLTGSIKSVGANMLLTREELLKTGSSEIQANAEAAKQRFKALKDEIGQVAQKSPEMAAKMVTAFYQSAQAAKLPKPVLDSLKAQLLGLSKRWNIPVTAETFRAQNAINYLIAINTGRQITLAVNAAGGSRNIYGMQFGGPVTKQRPYIVGEAGPELFVPNSNGSIVPNHKLGGMGGGGLAITINVGGSVVSERQLVDVVREGLRRDKRQGKGGI